MSGDDLDPTEISKLIGKPASVARKKGDQFKTPIGRSVTSRTGLWSIGVDDRAPGDLNSQVVEILEGTTQDVEVWRALSRKFNVEIFCGIFFEHGNEGFNISPDTMWLLGSRGIAIELDVYGVK